MIDRAPYSLGKGDAKFDSRRLKLADYAVAGLPTPPTSINWAPTVTAWPMLDNDIRGDCTIAGALHAAMVWMNNNQVAHPTPYLPTNATALKYYELWDGYVAGDPNTDQGGEETSVLSQWIAQGLDGHGLEGYVDPQPGNKLHIEQSIAFFGGVYIGLQLPVSAQTQTEWVVVPNDGGVWGGHAVYCYAFTATGPICASWNEIIPMTWGFWNKYCDESHTLLGNAWCPGGKDLINYAQFKADLALVTG